MWYKNAMVHEVLLTVFVSRSDMLSRQLPALLSSLLSENLQSTATSIREFPPFVPGRFRAIVDEELGFP
jgi:hypothetical protein